MRPGTTPYVSIILPTRNGMPLVEQCLQSVLTQETPWPFEVLAIDSESTDGTWELLESLPIRRVRIRAREFNHGRTRNQGAAMAEGQFLVFLVQDAVPADASWLQRLVEAAEEPGAAGSYSRQLSWPSDSPLVRLQIEQTLPQGEERAVQSLTPEQSWEGLSGRERLLLAMFCNSSSCVRRDVWARYPFANIPYGEDLEWCSRVIRAGYSTIYEPRSLVHHSHDRSSWYELKRAYADHHLVIRLFDYVAFPRFRGVIASWLKSSWRVIRLTCADSGPMRKRAVLALRAPLVIGVRHLGSCLGAQAGLRGSRGVLWHHLDRLMRSGV